MSKSRDIADSAATINYIDGLTSDAQGQLNDKATLDGSPTFTGTVTATAFSGDGSSLTGVDSLPSQTGNTGKFLTTDGSAASWDAVDISSEITGTLPVANGGTGATTLTANNVLLGNGTSAPLTVAPSTAGNILTSNGSTWQSAPPAGGGAWTYITSVTASGATTIDLTGMDNTYDQYVIVGENFLASTNSNLRGYMYVNGTLDTTGPYNYTVKQSSTNTFAQVTLSTGTTSFALASSTTFPTATDGRSLNFQLIFNNARNSNYFSYYEGFGTSVTTGYSGTQLMNGVHEVKTSLVTGIRLYATSGTMDGKLLLYGIKRS